MNSRQLSEWQAFLLNEKEDRDREAAKNRTSNNAASDYRPPTKRGRR